ncbi:MAG: sigma-70 family RNA polymerase sigma factor [Candidatus Sedimenticola sp. 6PFRAG7]
MKKIRQLFSMDSRTERLAGLRPRLLRLAIAWSRDPSLAEDLTQEALEKALKNLHRLKKEAAMEAWAFSILANCFRDHFRREPIPENPVEIEDPKQVMLDDQLATTQTAIRVRHAISRLSQGQREVLMLVDLEEFSYADVAEILDIPIGTVMSRLNRSRQQLKQLLMRETEREQISKPFLERVK